MWTAPRLFLASVVASSVALGACAGVKQNPAGQDGGANRGGNGGGLIGGTDGPPPPVDGIIIDRSGCGNGMLETDKGEKCDDGNTTPGDGCSRLCQIAEGWECPTPGSPCRLIAVCGDGKLASNETCDDGNKTNGDGCSADCNTIEGGYACRVPGRPCVPACGDGMIIMGKEECDDANTAADDGCSPTCVREPGATCMGTPSKCTAAVCGNKMVEAGESCDEGACVAGSTKCNGVFFGDGTGCSKTCTKEPKCRDGATTRACDTSCGNGNIEMGEQCDDGNLAAGDGCSPTCTNEAGFTCTPQMRPDTEPCSTGAGECLKLPVIFRDFKNESVNPGGHPDFFFYGAPVTGGPSITGVVGQPTAVAFNKRYCIPNTGGPAKKGDSTARCWDIAQPTLDAMGKPAFNAARTGGNLCPCQFTDWGHNGNGGHVPGYGDAMGAGRPLNGLTYAQSAAPGAAMTGAPWYSGNAPIVKDAASFGQWFTDNSFNGMTHTVGLLEMAPSPTAANQYQFASAVHSLYGGFFPLDPPGQFPATGSTAGPGAIRMVGTEMLVCNMWPYWYSNAMFGQMNNCRGDQYLLPPSVAMEGWTPAAQGWYHNFYFTSEARYLFNFSGAFSAMFYGDDDLFIYINGRLVLDLGGVHQRLPGQVTVNADGSATIIEGGSLTNTVPPTIVPCPGTDPNTMTATMVGLDCRTRTIPAATMGLQMGRTYEIAVFHADRAPSESNYQLTLSGFSTNRSNCGPTCGDGVATGAEECDCGMATASSDPACAGMTNNDTTYGGCTTMCKYGPYCGDGTMNGPEECDLGSKMNNATYGVNGCTPGCRKPHYCGDALVDEDEGEQCDLGSNNGMQGGTCSMDCKIIFG
jgi:fibro-slime domain-containing protein